MKGSPVVIVLYNPTYLRPLRIKALMDHLKEAGYNPIDIESCALNPPGLALQSVGSPPKPARRRPQP